MTVSEAVDKISKALGVLTYQTRAENLAGLFSKNRLTEDLLLPVFRLVLKAPHLRNVNQDATNFPYIDLADDQARLAVQVTTERAVKKVTETLTNFIAQSYQKRYDRLIFFILTPNEMRYAASSKKEWQRICGRKLRFEPGSDIITTLQLLPLIQGLAHPDLYSIHDIVSRSVIGERYVDVEGYLTSLTGRQLEYEKTSGKYIPDIFVETRETKNLARSFAHPTLFFRRTLESIGRIDIASWNDFLARAGLPPLPMLRLSAFGAERTLAQIRAAAEELSSELAAVSSVVAKYEKFSDKDPPFQVREDRRYYYEENIFTLQHSLGWGLNHQLKELVDELTVAQARIFILTGRAGQGKTNLVCDFVENFLSKHNIPCAYFTGRQLRSCLTPDLGDAIQRLMFKGATSSFAEAAGLLSAYADRNDKPLVLIIDGLNEHHRISEFSEQLQLFIESALEYPSLKLFLTCRSEFFAQRFGSLTTGGLKPHIFLLQANERRLDEECHNEMLTGYFKFFEVRREMVSDRAVDSLKKDFLLLRFFCEAYGRRDKSTEYLQPYIAHIYRDEIFKMYLERKLGTADLFLRQITGKVKPANEKGDLLKVLEQCVEHMLKAWQFANVPVSAIPTNLNDALYALLDEELILRRDAPPGLSVFSESQETINFTFDEFRDFLLAQYLIHLFETDRVVFEHYIARNDPKDSQIIEGLKKFLFYASRLERNKTFWDFFRDRRWYKDVYDHEVFNINKALLQREDRDLVVSALQDGGERARAFARRLAVCWASDYFPILNLDLLLSFATQSEDSQFDDLIVAGFKSALYFHEGATAEAFCKFITDSVLPTLKPDPSEPENSLFRFLILLLPVDSVINLDSHSFFVFRRLLDLHPIYAINLLSESLGYRPTRHRTYVWRLLASVSPLSLVEAFLAQARTEQSRAVTSDPTLHREVSRFLSRFDLSITTKTAP